MRLLKVLKNPLILFAYFWVRSSKWIHNDILYLKVLFFCKTLIVLRLKNPKRFTEKLQWLKIYYNRSVLHTQLVDKYRVRKFISQTIGDEFLFPLIGVWERVDDIDLSLLPDQFVLKTNHDSGGIWICKNKTSFKDKWPTYKEEIRKRLKSNYYLKGREYPYKNVEPCVIAEKYMVDESGIELKDYKFFCFNGEPQILFYASERFAGKVTNFDFFDMNLNRIPMFAKGHPTTKKIKLNIPNYDKMVEIAKKLSSGFPHVRIDLYNINGQIYFGEFTFHHDGGFVPFYPKDWDIKMGNYIQLPQIQSKMYKI